MRVSSLYSLLALGALFSCVGVAGCGDDDPGGETVAGKDGGGGAAGDSGRGDRSDGGPTGGRGGRGEPDPVDCEQTVKEFSAVVAAPLACSQCVCDVSPATAMACTPDCWRLAYCVAASGCALNDTPCIRGLCVTLLGGIDKYMAAAQLAMSVPFATCCGREDGWDAGR